METRNISENEWIEFFDRFSGEHTGWLATIQVLDPQQGPHQIMENLPLQGVSFDSKGTRPSTIDISAGDETGRHVNHVVDLPLHIREAHEPNGDVDIQIEPANGPVTLLHLTRPTP